jgi:hypothetical protein
MGLVEMFTNALASILSSLAEKFDDFPMELPLQRRKRFLNRHVNRHLPRLVVDIGQVHSRINNGNFQLCFGFCFWECFHQGSILLCPAEEVDLVFFDGLSAAM